MNSVYWLGRLASPAENLPRYVAPGSVIFLAGTDDPPALWGLGVTRADDQGKAWLDRTYQLPHPVPLTDAAAGQSPWAVLTDEQATGLLRAISDQNPDLAERLHGILPADLINQTLGAGRAGLIISPHSLKMLRALLDKSRGVLITGPAGSGKTSLAIHICEQAVRAGQTSGYLMASASPDWTTFDTIGGYLPGSNGGFAFRDGLFLQAIRQNQWLIVDELDQASASRAFGPFLTALEGKGEVSLPFQTPTGQTLRLITTTAPDCRVEDGRYYIGRNWRLIGTAHGGFDPVRYPLDPALFRRLALFQMPFPTKDELRQVIKQYALSDASRQLVERLLDAAPAPITPGMLTSLCGFLETSSDLAVDALLSFVLPQFSAHPPADVQTLLIGLRSVLRPAEYERLVAAATYQYGLSPDFLGRTSQEGSHGPQ